MKSKCQSKNVLIIYHRADYDGLFSGNIARKFYIESEYEVDLKGYNYGDQVPDFDEILKNYTEVCILDVSFDAPIMKTLHESGKVYWIDHHIGTTRLSEESGYSEMLGERTDLKIGAVEVAWDYFFKGMEKPHIIELISAYDVWDHDRFVWDLETAPLQYALRAEYNLSIEKLWRHWDRLLYDLDYLETALQSGRFLTKYLNNVWKSWCGNYAFDVLVAGKYKAICMLSAQGGSLQFESELTPENGYDLQLVVNRKGPDLYNVGIYKKSDDCNDFDCAKFASEVYKTGNGHKSAAGFTLNLEQFTRLIKDQVL
jgi:oligoribonuclease NrnB/cAMP/cGMP phosphodiesterase (DHH superfamily)